MSRVIFLHGVGSSGAAMQPLGSALGVADRSHFPDGPAAFDMGPGRQWFSVRGVTEQDRPDRIRAAMPGFRSVVEAFGPARDSVLIGFSQGAIMALHAVADGLPAKAVFAISGRLAGPVPRRTDWPPITLIHGAADTVIPARMALSTEAWLREAGAMPEMQIFDGLAHGIDDRALGVLREGLTGVLV